MRKIFSFLANLLFSLLFTLVLIEAGLRLFPGVVPLQLLIHFDEKPRTEIAQRRSLPTKWGTVVVERDDGGPELRIFKPFAEVAWPGREERTIVMDQIGFCNPPESDYQAPQIDLITIGDSFTTCHGVEPQETWTSQLATLMELSAYNLGRGKTGVHEHIQILQKFGLQKSPRLVIMNVYEGNDLRDAAMYYYYRLNHTTQENEAAQPASAPATSPAPASSPMVTLLQHYSYGYNLAGAFLVHLATSQPAASGVPEQSDPFALPVSDVPSHYFAGIGQINFNYQLMFAGEKVKLNRKNADNDEVLVARHLYNGAVEPGVMEAIEEALATFVALSKQYDFVPVVTYTPSAHTAYAAQVVFADPGLSELMPWFSRYQRDYFKEKGEALGYTFIDLTPALQAAAQVNGARDLLYSDKDLHLTPSGHRVVAQAINQAFQDLRILALSQLDSQ